MVPAVVSARRSSVAEVRRAGRTAADPTTDTAPPTDLRRRHELAHHQYDDNHNYGGHQHDQHSFHVRSLPHPPGPTVGPGSTLSARHANRQSSGPTPTSSSRRPRLRIQATDR